MPGAILVKKLICTLGELTVLGGRSQMGKHAYLRDKYRVKQEYLGRHWIKTGEGRTEGFLEEVTFG